MLQKLICFREDGTFSNEKNVKILIFVRQLVKFILGETVENGVVHVYILC